MLCTVLPLLLLLGLAGTLERAGVNAGKHTGDLCVFFGTAGVDRL